MRRLSTFALAALLVTFFACDNNSLTGPDTNIQDLALSKKGGKPGGGGGPGGEEPTPAGVIYAELVGIGQVAMDPDGNVFETLHPDVWGDPSHERYWDGADSVRWFVTSESVSGVYPDSAGRSALVAVSETGSKVTLVDDPLFNPSGDARWSPTPVDGRIAFTGRRFSSAGAAADEGGIYIVNVTFAAGVPSATSPTLLIPGTVTQDPEQCTTTGICDADSDLGGPEWSPDGTQMLFGKVDLPVPPDSSELEMRSSIYLYDGGTETLLASPGASPRWSQSESGEDVVLFRDYTLLRKGFTNRLWTVNADGSGQTLVEEINDNSKGANTANHSFARFNGHEWSPDGGHFAYVIRECQLWAAWCNIRLVRRKADGSSETITPDVYRLHGWR